MPEDASFDPWAGKRLGGPEPPEGFEEFWRQQEQIAKGGSSVFLAQQEAILANRPPPGTEGGRGRGGRGARYPRYSAPEPRAPRARPSHFVAIRLYSRMIRRNVQQMQQWFLERDPRFERCIVPVRRIHSSLLLTSVPQERRTEAKEACHEAGREIRAFLGDQPVKLTCSGVGSFNGQVLFARIRTEPHEMLQAIHEALARAFMRHGFPVLDETAKSWLDDGEEPHAFKAHASFIKVSKALVHSETDEQKRALRALRVTVDDLAAWKDVFFGTQLCHEFELLDMVGSTRDGFYPCMQLERFNDRPLGPGVGDLTVKLAAGPLRTGRLRVECGDAGAGLELSPCPAGYLIERLREWPGQPDLREGDVLVAIGGELLLGLEEGELERRFRERFCNGAAVVAGPWAVLEKLRQTSVRGAAERLLRPWQKAAAEAAAEEGEAEESVSLYSAYTAGGTRVRGRRYQLRTTAESFAPDPLSRPGGDPWAEAAERGYEYPEYTGWGTRFQKRRATKVDSSIFRQRPSPAGPRWDAAGAGRDEERTLVHQRLRKALWDARSHAAVLKVVGESRALLSLSNRALALSRLVAAGRLLPDELRRDERLKWLLADVEEDLEAVVEADASLAPAMLGGLAQALGQLGLRRPELFRALAEVARRAGIWAFADEEVAALLEGFSRARLIDEVLFQEAARLLVARVGKVAPRLLTTMLTAFACSNVATEQLFFAVGDAVVACQRHYSSGQLAELADAFSRVRARHALLLDVVPAHFGGGAVKDRGRCSIEALVKLFSAYVDVRQELGPEGFREELAAALCQRRAELSSRLMRQVLQAAARARWPSVALLELASEVAARDHNEWEAEAMRTCFDQLRVLPPDGFPAAVGRDQRSDAERGSPRKPPGEAREAAGGAAAAAAAVVAAAAAPPAAAAAAAAAVAAPAAAAGEAAGDTVLERNSVPVPLRTGRLNLGGDNSAGLELTACAAGYLVEEVGAEPGQPDIASGDVVVAIGGHALVGLDEDEVELRFGQNFGPAAPIVVGALEALQRLPLEDVRQAVADLITSPGAPAEVPIEAGEQQQLAQSPDVQDAGRGSDGDERQGGKEERCRAGFSARGSPPRAVEGELAGDPAGGLFPDEYEPGRDSRGVSTVAARAGGQGIGQRTGGRAAARRVWRPNKAPAA